MSTTLQPGHLDAFAGLLAEPQVQSLAVIAVGGRKGGIGKSTTAFNLAAASGSPLIDADPQGTSAALAEATPATALKLKTVLDQAEKQAPLVWLDLPPRLDTNVLEAMRRADFLLLPCPPEQPCFTALEATIEKVASVGKLDEALVVLTLVAPQASASYLASFKEAVEELGVTVTNTLIHRRADAANAWAYGQSVMETAPKSKAAQEVQTLWKEVKRRWKLAKR